MMCIFFISSHLCLLLKMKSSILADIIGRERDNRANISKTTNTTTNINLLWSMNHQRLTTPDEPFQNVIKRPI
ncbi:hypothetical protein Hanom_Chr06g00578181 [Helianthus anomalus]